MIVSEERTYGWGAGGILMPREVGGNNRPGSPRSTGALFRDLPWVPLLASLLLTFTGMLALLFLDRHLPPLVPQKTPATVKIAMRLPAEAPMPAVEAPAPREERPTVKPRTPEKPPRPQPMAPPPPPPPPAPEPATASPPPPPLQPVAVVKTSPPPPAKSKREKPAELPPRQEAVRLGRGETPLGPGPDLRPRAGRQAVEDLPAAPVTLSGLPQLDVATSDSGVSRPRYRPQRPEAAMPAAETRQTLAVAAGEINPGAAPKLDPQRFQRKNATASALPAARPSASFAPSAAADVTPPPVAAAARTATTVSAALPAGAGGSFDFLDRVAQSDLDRGHLVSLNRLRTCLDPGEEMKLRTRLATLLSRPGTCRAGGVVFDIRQPESAWSIHVDIYNYEKREFQDRCAALRLAVSGCEGGRR